MPAHRVSGTTSAAHIHHIFFPHCEDGLSQYQPVNDGVQKCVIPLANLIDLHC